MADDQTTPTRVQLRRLKGWRMPENTVVVRRPSEWGNPWRMTKATFLTGERKGQSDWHVDRGVDANPVYIFQDKDKAHEALVTLFRSWVEHPAQENYRARARLALRGKPLACTCRLDQPCHADVLLELANG